MRKKLLLFFFSLLFSICLVEFILRIFPKQPVENWGNELLCGDKQLDKILKPGKHGRQLVAKSRDVEITANQRGYRDTEWKEKTLGVRIMLLGDSFGFGWGCRFEKTLGRILDLKENLAVYNLCIPGDDLVDYAARYSFYRSEIQPSIVILLLYINDFFSQYDSTNIRLSKRIDSTNYQPQCFSYPRTVRDHLNRSYLYNFINHYRSSTGIVFSSEERRKRMIRKGYAADISYLDNEGASMKSAFDFLEAFLSQLHQFNNKVFIVYIPPEYAIDPEAWSELKRVFNSELDTIHPEIVDSRLVEISTKMNIPYVSLAAQLRESKTTSYFRVDGHLNENGHAIAADAIHKRLKQFSVVNSE